MISVMNFNVSNNDDIKKFLLNVSHLPRIRIFKRKL